MAGFSYWRDREEENHRHLIATEKKMAAHTSEIYERMMCAVQKEIEAFYGRYAGREEITLAVAKQRISKADMEYLSKQAAKYVEQAQRGLKTGDGRGGEYFSEQANAEMRLYNVTMRINRLEFLKGEIGSHLVDGYDELNRYFDGKFTEQAMEEFRRRAVILGTTIPADAERRAQEIVNGSFRNAKYSDRLWRHQGMLRMDIGRQLEQGLLRGAGSAELARAIRKVFGGSRSNAERLMRTEMCRIQTGVAKASYEKNGNKHFVYMALGINPCPVCEALDGKIFPVPDLEAGLNAPPMHPNCHCATGPSYTEEEDKLYNGWLKSGAAREGMLLEKFKNEDDGKGLAASGINAAVESHEPPEFIRKVLDTEDRRRILSDYEKQIVDSPIENAIVITKDGNLYHCRGTLNGVYPDVDLGEELRGADMTHNHPEGSGNE